MIQKVLGLVAAGVFVGAAVIEAVELLPRRWLRKHRMIKPTPKPPASVPGQARPELDDPDQHLEAPRT